MYNHSDLIGVPFEYGGRDNTLDCYGLIMELYRRDHGIEIPDYGSTAHAELAESRMILAAFSWTRLQKPEPGAVLLIRCGKHVRHVGYVVEDDMFYHTWEKSGGVVCEPLDVWNTKIVGIYKYAK